MTIKRTAVIEGVVTDEQNTERAARNMMRAQAAIVALGHRWVGWIAPKEIAETMNVSPMKRKASK